MYYLYAVLYTMICRYMVPQSFFYTLVTIPIELSHCTSTHIDSDLVIEK